MYLANEQIKKYNLYKSIQEHSSKCDSFREIISGMSEYEVSKNIQILEQGNELFFDETRKFHSKEGSGAI